MNDDKPYTDPEDIYKQALELERQRDLADFGPSETIEDEEAHAARVSAEDAKAYSAAYEPAPEGFAQVRESEPLTDDDVLGTVAEQQQRIYENDKKAEAHWSQIANEMEQERAQPAKPIVFNEIDDEQETRRRIIAEQANQSAIKQRAVTPAEPEPEDDDEEAQQLANLAEASQIASAREQSDDISEYVLDDSVIEAADIQASADEREERRRNNLAKSVVNRYTINGTHYLVPGMDKQEAFTDHGKRIKVRLEDERTVQDAVDLLVSRGAQSIKVTGTAVVRRHAWIAAQRHDIAITGYKPTAQDIAVYRKQKPENVITETTEQAHQNAPVQAATPSKSQSTLVVSGKLIEHAQAPYQHVESNNQSYYVTVESNGETKTQWGVGLKDAISKSGVQPGDNVSLRKVDSTAVTLKDKQGKTIQGKRGAWVVESPERDELTKAAALREAAKAVSTKFTKQEDRDSMTRGMDERIASHQGSLPDVKIRKAVQRDVQREEQKQQLTP